jgi:hypothetical protein
LLSDPFHLPQPLYYQLADSAHLQSLVPVVSLHLGHQGPCGLRHRVPSRVGKGILSLGNCPNDFLLYIEEPYLVLGGELVGPVTHMHLVGCDAVVLFSRQLR